MASLGYRLGIIRARILKGVDPMLRCTDATPALISLALGLSLGLALDSGATPPLGDLAISGQTFDGTHARVPDWSNAGVIGDIPDTSNTTNWPKVNITTETASGCGHFLTSNSDTTNGTNLQCIINYYNAHQQGAQGTVLYIPNGTYNVSGTIRLLSNLDIMGQSGAGTIVNVTGGRLSTAPSDNSLHPTNGIAITNTVPIPYGTTVFTTASAPGYSAGQWVLVAEDCDNSKFTNGCASNNNGTNGVVVTPVQGGCPNGPKCGLGSGSGGWYLGAFAKVVSSVGTTVTLDRGIREPMAAGNPQIFTVPATMTQNSGFENITWTGTTGFPIYLSAAANVWIRGNTINDNLGQGFFSIYTVNATWRTNTINGELPPNCSTNCGGATFRFNNVYESRFEDNILLNVDEAMVIQGASEGNAVAYNFRANEIARYLNRIMTLHGMYMHELLAEGNTGNGSMFMDDFPWGNTGPRNVFFRNVLVAANPSSGNVESILGPLSAGVEGPYSSWIGNVAGDMRVGGGGPIGAGNNDNSNGQLGSDHAWLERNRVTEAMWTGNNLNTSAGGGSGNQYCPHNGAVYWGTASCTGGTGICGALNANNDALCVGMFGPLIHWTSHPDTGWTCPDGVTVNNACPTAYNGTTVPTYLSSGNMPASLYLTAKPSWWCQESNWPAVGADVTTITGSVGSHAISSTTPANAAGYTPAMRRYAGLSCTTGGGGLPAALGAPGQPTLMP